MTVIAAAAKNARAPVAPHRRYAPPWRMGGMDGGRGSKSSRGACGAPVRPCVRPRACVRVRACAALAGTRSRWARLGRMWREAAGVNGVKWKWRGKRRGGTDERRAGGSAPPHAHARRSGRGAGRGRRRARSFTHGTGSAGRPALDPARTDAARTKTLKPDSEPATRKGCRRNRLVGQTARAGHPPPRPPPREVGRACW